MNRNRSRVWWGLLILVLLAAAVFFGYYLGRDNAPVEKTIPLGIKEVEPGNKSDKEINEKEPKKVRVEIKEKEPSIGVTSQPITEDYCAQIESQIHDFFIYLDSKDYVKKIGLKYDSFTLYKKILGEFSANLPIPSGESLSPEIMNKNIFFLFRTIDSVDIYFMKEVLKNEADTMEMNFDLFYKYFMLKDQCPGRENTRPSFQVLYRYAGFFLNTIGGRAYLFRRTSALRLLMTYYSILIIHDADKKGKNNYGIDIFPEIEPLTKEIGIFPDLRFRNEYISRLMEIKNYYAEKR